MKSVHRIVAIVFAAVSMSACAVGTESNSASNNSPARVKNAALTPTCATGGDCRVGDIGPGGGIVFYDAGSVKPWGRYLESVPRDVASNQLWCDIYRDLPGAMGTAIGDGRQNTIDMDAGCSSGVGQIAADFVYGGKDDWWLPSKDELTQMFLQKRILGLTSQFLFSSSETGAYYAWDIYMGDGTVYPQGKNNGRIVRVIRGFVSSPVTAPTTMPPLTAPPTTMPPLTLPPTTSPLVTAVAAPCADGGPCKVGDKGPGGGTIFYDAGKDNSWGRYLELVPSIQNRILRWCSTGRQIRQNGYQIGDGLKNTTFAISERCSVDTGISYAWGYATPTRDDWFMPSFDEMFALMNSKVPLPSGDYWMSTRANMNDGLYMDNRSISSRRGQYGQWSLATGAFLTAPIRYSFSGERATGKPGPAPTTTTTTTTTTTAVPTFIAGAPCESGGPCKVGDKGPGGGIVFYDAGTRQSWGQFLEGAPRDYTETRNGSTNVVVMAWCSQGRDTSNTPGADRDGIGAGVLNTADIAQFCTDGAGRFASDYVSNGKDDWFLPSKTELDLMLKRVDLFGKNSNLNPNGIMVQSSQCYWSSTELTGSYAPFNAWMQQPQGMYQISYVKRQSCLARFIRAF